MYICIVLHHYTLYESSERIHRTILPRLFIKLKTWIIGHGNQLDDCEKKRVTDRIRVEPVTCQERALLPGRQKSNCFMFLIHIVIAK